MFVAVSLPVPPGAMHRKLPTPLTQSLKLKLKSKPKSKPQWKLEKEDGCHIWLYFWPARAARQVIHPLGATPAYQRLLPKVGR